MRRSFGILLAALALAGAGDAAAASFKVVHVFHSGSDDGYVPAGPLLGSIAGDVYGTTEQGGANSDGTVFGLHRNPDGSYDYVRRLADFPLLQSGRAPGGALIQDVDGNLYGITTQGEAVYRLSPPRRHKKWVPTVLFIFAGTTGGTALRDGLAYAGQAAGLPYDGVSPLYGVTTKGGANDEGVVYELTHTGDVWSETVLHDFCSEGGARCSDGKEPAAQLTVDADGNLYGTTRDGGRRVTDSLGSGVAFRLSPAGGGTWSETVLHTFCAERHCHDGLIPGGPLLADAAGNLFGVTENGGHCAQELGCGTLYKLAPDGSGGYSHSVLHAFCMGHLCRDGNDPTGPLAMDASGTLYGTTNYGGIYNDDIGVGGGVVYRYAGGTFGVLHRFCAKTGCPDGKYAGTGLYLDASGALLGVAARGGRYALGVVFELTP